MMYSAYKLNKQGDNIQPWHTPFPIWNQSVAPCLLLTVASWPAYRFFRRQVSSLVFPSLSLNHNNCLLTEKSHGTDKIVEPPVLVLPGSYLTPQRNAPLTTSAGSLILFLFFFNIHFSINNLFSIFFPPNQSKVWKEAEGSQPLSPTPSKRDRP